MLRSITCLTLNHCFGLESIIFDETISFPLDLRNTLLILRKFHVNAPDISISVSSTCEVSLIQDQRVRGSWLPGKYHVLLERAAIVFVSTTLLRSLCLSEWIDVFWEYKGTRVNQFQEIANKPPAIHTSDAN